MLMCIYLTRQQGLYYDSADHIVPAGLGSMQKLPPDYVSREFNNLSSRLERVLMRSSIISMPRQILGPGKRGSLNPRKATKSTISVFRPRQEGSMLSLGYIQNGRPFEMPHIVFNSQTGALAVGMSRTITNDELESFKINLTSFDSLRTKMIEHRELEPNVYLLGIMSGVEDNTDCFSASRDGINHPFNTRLLTHIASLVQGRSVFTGSMTSLVRTHQKAVVNSDYYRCCAKIAFNCLAHLTDKEFVLQDYFNPLRNWIVNGGENHFVSIVPNQEMNFGKLFPEDSHYILITKTAGELRADVCFYNHFHNIVCLCSDFSGPFEVNGFICNWKEKRETTYRDLMNALVIKD